MKEMLYLPLRISIFALLTALMACGGGGESDTNTIDAAITYTVAGGSSNRRYVTNLTGSERLAIDEADFFPGPQFSPNRNYIAYVRNNTVYVAHTNSNTVTELSRFQHDNGKVNQLVWAPNSQYVAYIGNLESGGNFNAYVVTVDGSSHTQINPEMPSVFVSGELSFSPASDWITYRANQDTPNLYDGYVTRIDGTENRRFTGVINSTVRLEDFQWSPNGRYIAYRVIYNSGVSSRNGINTHDTRAGGRDSRRISHDFSSHVTYSELEEIHWSPKSDLLAYSLNILRNENANGFGFNRRLFTARASAQDGGSALTINGPMDIASEVGDWAWSPDGNYVAYEVVSIFYTGSILIRQDVGINTYDVNQGGNGSGNSLRVTKITGGPLGQGPKAVDDMSWTSDSQYIVYRAFVEKSNTRELYRSEPDLSENESLLSLETGISNEDHVGSFALAPDGQQVAYAQRTEGFNSPYKIYITDVVDPLLDTQVSSMPVVGGQINPPVIRWNSSSTYVGFTTDADTVGKTELYVAPNNGAGSQKVSGSIAANADVNSFEFIK